MAESFEQPMPSNPAISLAETLLARSEERAELLRCYERSRSGLPTFILLRGPSGAGKQRLVQSTLEERVVQDGGELLVGNFDLLQQPEPYHGFLQAFQQYPEASGLFATAADPTAAAIPSKGNNATEAVPKEVSDDNTATSTEKESSNSSTTATKQQQESPTSTHRFAFLLFLRSITQPVVLLLTNLQHANACALKILEGVITDLEQFPNVLVVATTTDTENIENVPCLSKASAVISVDNLSSQEQIGKFIAAAWKTELSSDLQLELASILFQKTRGNIFEITETLMHWLDGKLVTFDVDGTLVVDRSRLDEWSQVYNSSSILEHRLQEARISTGAIEILKVASCFGTSVSLRILHSVLSFGTELLDEAEALRFIYCDMNHVYFSHEKTRRAIYKLIPEDDVLQLHVSVGRSLWASFTAANTLQSNLFVLLRHYLIGRKLIKDKKERNGLAHLCLAAGRKAWGMSAFHTASICLDFGIEVLGDSGWDEEYELTLGCYNTAAEMYLCLPDFDAAAQMIDTVCRRAREEDDRIQSEITRLYLLCTSNRQIEGVDLGLKLLDRLGEPFPKRNIIFFTLVEHQRVRLLLGRRTDAELLLSPPMTDRKKLQCMQILNLLFFHATIVRQSIAPMVAIKFVSLTLRYGTSLMAPQAFACYGMVMSKIKRYDDARRFGLVGIKLLEILGHDESIPRVYAAWYGAISSLHRPIHGVTEKLLEGHRIGLQTGDFEFAALCANLYLYYALDGWVSLPTLHEEYLRIESAMKALNQETMVRFMTPLVQSVRHLMGKGDHVSPNGNRFDFEVAHEFCVSNNLECMALGINIHRLVLCSILGDFESGLVFAIQCVNSLRSVVSPDDYIFAMMFACITLMVHARNGSFWERRRAIHYAKKALKFMKQPCLNCPENYLHKTLLIEAELYAFLGREQLAMQKYVCAIETSKSFLTASFSRERAARFLFSCGRCDEASRYCKEALQFYQEWGATAKVDRLKAELGLSFPKEVGNAAVGGSPRGFSLNMHRK